MVNLKKELEDNQVILLLMPGKEYNEDIVKKLKYFSSSSSVFYVTLNKTYSALSELCKKHKVKSDNVVFVDTISKTIKKTPDQSKQVYYVSSPGALTEISLVVSKFLKHEFDYMIFDSLTNLAIYTKRAPVGKFLSSLIHKIKGTKTKAVFYAISSGENDELIKQAEMFVDKVIVLGKNKGGESDD